MDNILYQLKSIRKEKPSENSKGFNLYIIFNYFFFFLELIQVP